ncbi:MAG: hypothetical protein II949_10430 [Prevotella sp.]|nr:hypothetical protein [Prevotella sp.]
MMKTMTNKAGKAVKRLTPLLLLPLLPLFNACYEYDESDRQDLQETVPLTFYLQTAGQQATRAYEGDVQDKSAESAINSISVWLFDHGKTGETPSTAGLLLDYQDVFADPETRKVTMNVPKYIVEQAHNVDVYAIANVEQAGLTQAQLKAVTTIDGLKALTMQGTNFTPTGATKLGGTDGVTYLPMSRILQDWPVVDQTGGTNKISTKLGTVDITRAVSKIRFAFARTTGIDDVKVTGIELDGAQIPSVQYILPIDSITNPGNYATVEGKGRYIGDKLPNINTSSYITNALVMRADGDTDWSTQLFDPALMKDYATPENYTWEAMKTADPSLTAQAYDELMSTVIGVDTYDFTTYLRETDKVITGKIHYMVGEQKKTATFQMAADQANDFARNHEWIVYGYFKGEELELTFTVLPWNKWLRKTDYKSNVSVSQQLHWIDGTYDNTNTNAAAPITIDGTPHTVMVLTYGTSIEGGFSFDTPYGGTWMAILEPINGSENGSIVFTSNNETTLSGTIGTNAVTFQIKAAENQVSRNQYARLRFVCYSQDNQPYVVNDEVIGGPYVIAQYAN